WQNSAVRISARRLNGIDTDMKDVPDIVPSAAVMALFAEGPSRLREVEHLRYKETDRLQALVENIERLGGIARIEGTNLSIVPAPLKGTCLPTFNDHRMAMSFALVGLRIPEVYIENPGCVVKSFPEFWSGLDRLREPAL
ncbi:MAG: 3-phosphoshikimate 1-carboxyvinyltransferase, partial [Calditrichaeota bacterium]